MKKLVILLAFCMALPCALAAKDKKIRGYVTRLISPTSFEIEDYRITRDMNLVLEFEKSDEDKEPIDFRPEDIRVGTEIEIKGEFDEKTGELRAKTIKVILEDARKVKRAALIERPPLIKRVETGWEGSFFADGQRINVGAATHVYFKPNRSEKEAQKKKDKGAPEKDAEAEAVPLQSIEQVVPNTFMNYEGIRQPDGSVAATKVEFTRNELEKGEAKMWKDLTPKVKHPSFVNGKAGELKLNKVGKFKLVPSEEGQSYIRALGEKLIPSHQRALPVGHPEKIPFQFFLIEEKYANAFATANGVIAVNSALVNLLENEAQLVAVMSHEIAHSIQEHTWRQHQYHRKKLIALRIGGIAAGAFGIGGVQDIATLIEAAVRNGYSRSLENQADRAGLEYMLAAGYDIREAPRVWKQFAKEYGDRGTNFFWSSHDNNTTRRSYLMAELRMNYPDAAYEKLQTNPEEFQKMQALIRNAKGKGKVKVKM